MIRSIISEWHDGNHDLKGRLRGNSWGPTPRIIGVRFAGYEVNSLKATLTAKQFATVMEALARMMDGEPFDETVIPD